ncbi:hypothetical protein M427DRAFT_64408 [Gonapodya prolifera JEL478]|uniref:Biogenesis of lysosome-related organelles complex 1 subunit 1 n=1 Tax=Gonapodya prolifera (strain JEL478) TaxID=1344416 RepID=A0A138ZXL6_GONPJ|nr:hypothetical protein M427DRAFT_64408 [Gonapodya prolifera JEL478]|eukprot:KXS09246.1 hypothetical protein M427DRAFT_64408 [Gonapodya prolifera JEL478]
MLAQILKDRQAKLNQEKTRIENLRRDAQSSLEHLTEILNECLNTRVGMIFRNEREIEAEEKVLSANIDAIHLQVKQWSELLTTFDTALKELGDISNWASVMERELLQTVTTMELANGQKPSYAPQSNG